MQLKSLTLTDFRSFEQATFEFQPGMNLLVGINGVGKSSVLDALRIVLSRVLPNFTACQDKRLNFEVDDIMVGRDQLAVDLKFQAFDIPFVCNVTRGKNHKVEFKPDNKNILEPLKSDDEQPLVVYFSTRRSVPIEKVLNEKSSAGNQSAAFAEALTHRMLRLREFAEWWLVQQTLLGEDAALAQQRLKVMTNVVTRFLDWCTNLRAVDKPKTTLILDKDGMTIDVSQLSDGERGLLALVLDLARRLSQANPNLKDPLENGKAVVLIDEIDLHLHPRWQRTIVDQLIQTFPKCQFIATTHSPQIVGEVPAESILLLESGQQPFRPGQSLGMDSNWVLRYLMGAATRDSTTEQALSRIADMIENEEYDEATNVIDDMRCQIGEFPELVRLQTRIDRIRLLGE
ncbi:chromosome segregation protein SMC [Nostoc sp. 'Peltigera membranacea cyanobiont' 210A]|uniref:AAA family ATPase n=1 Tax=Nostoc sp. 'Peltigera membranacea cyanobiont' 210A TaxID=2014529 RepID=UPI000B95B3AF|nr:AAA family ATPase [Nostoc sp. 'Peltigera membranacea cyanobiont' 210A]OYD92395.1 chromosome segregation protein SMC [Nostoc sp. 'Peltigera membranacea cyanobiont' 210A]